MPVDNSRKIDPLNWQTKIINPDGTPSAEFLRQWQAQRGTNTFIEGEADGAKSKAQTALDKAIALEDTEVGGDDVDISPAAAALKDGNIELSLKSTGVSAGTYGSATRTARVTVDAKGRLTEVEEVAIAGGGGGGQGYAMSYVIDSATGYTPEALNIATFAPAMDFSPWTVFNMTEATVDLYATAGDFSGNRYDLSSREGSMLVQPDSGGLGTGSCGLRYDGMIADGETFVLKVATPGSQDDGNNDWRVGISVNDSNSGPVSGDFCILYYDASDSSNITLFSGSVIGNTVNGANVGGPNYFRMTRTGAALHFFHSATGEAWSALGSTAIGTFDNVWVYAGNAMSGSEAAPIVDFQWIKHVASIALDPF